MADDSNGWFKTTRGEAPWELLTAFPMAYLLACVIAHRARWSDGFNRHGLALGEAFLGDYGAFGMTQQQYRTAKAQLEKHGFATFKSTNKGTIGKLIDTRLFSTSLNAGNEQNNEQPTSSQRAGNERVTTNKEGKERIEGKEITSASPAPANSAPTEPKAPRAQFVKPTLEMVKLQFAKIGLPESEAERFTAYYESNGWRVGRNPMANWAAACRNWKSNYESNRNGKYQRTVENNPRNVGTCKPVTDYGEAAKRKLARQDAERESYFARLNGQVAGEVAGDAASPPATASDGR